MSRRHRSRDGRFRRRRVWYPPHPDTAPRSWPGRRLPPSLCLIRGLPRRPKLPKGSRSQPARPSFGSASCHPPYPREPLTLGQTRAGLVSSAQARSLCAPIAFPRMYPRIQKRQWFCSSRTAPREPRDDLQAEPRSGRDAGRFSRCHFPLRLPAPIRYPGIERLSGPVWAAAPWWWTRANNQSVIICVNLWLK